MVSKPFPTRCVPVVKGTGLCYSEEILYSHLTKPGLLETRMSHAPSRKRCGEGCAIIFVMLATVHSMNLVTRSIRQVHLEGYSTK
jgi:hypothetical protein